MAKWRSIVCAVVCILFVCVSGHLLAAQLPGDTIPSIPGPLARSYSQRHPVNKKRFYPAAGQLMLGEIVPLTFDRYIKNADYAKISFQNIGQNLSPSSWTWDDDAFETNQIGHPYHGSLFYNAFRSNGYSFWQSVPASFVGSYIWETFAESQLPSPNDFINTGFGGIMLGEMTFRLVDKIHNNRSHGFTKQASEVLALLINPMDGFKRIVDGKWGRLTPTATGPDPPQLNTEFDLGLRKFNVNNSNPFRDGHFGLYGRMKLIYGSPSRDYKKPFSNIYITTEFGEDDSSKLNIVSVHGSITGWKIYSGKREHLAILSANYDYIKNESFFYSAESIKLNVYSEFLLSGKTKLNTSVGAGAIILSAIPDAYPYFNRNYDYGPGISVSGSCRFSIADKFMYRINYSGNWTTTINGNQSDYFLHTITNEINIRVAKNASVSAESGYFSLYGNYRQYDAVTKKYPYLRLSVRWGNVLTR